MRPVHAGKLERWLGIEKIEQISRAMKGWYGPPIAVAGVPGAVWAMPDGDFAGKLNCGGVSSAIDFVIDRMVWRIKRAFRLAARRQFSQLNAGFSSISDLISEATAGAKSRRFAYMKAGSTGVANATNTLWRVGNQPSAGGAGSAAPGGRAPTDATAGGFPFANPASGDTQHIVSSWAIGSVVNNNLLLYDRIFDVAKTMSSTGTEAVTGVPTRYQNTTAGTVDSAEGNFLFIECFAALGATAHNWTVCTYKDQAGGSSTLPSLTGNSSCIIDRLDHPTGQWFAPLEAGDTGVQALTQMQCSASVTGSINFVLGHVIAWMPILVAAFMCDKDYITTAFNLTRIFDDACLAFLEVIKPATTATNYTGEFLTCAG